MARCSDAFNTGRVGYGAPVLALLLIAVVAAPPRALPEAELVAFSPRLERFAEGLPFFDAAGTRVALLRPQSWREFTHPLLQFDPTSRDSMKAVGVDPTGGLTVSRRGDLEVACVSLSDPKAYESACETKLKSVGVVTRKTIEGAVVVSARDQLNRVLLAYAIKGKISCAATNHGLTLERVLPELAKLVSAAKPPSEPGFKAAAELPGVISIIRPSGSPSGAMSVSSKGLTTTLDAQLNGLASSLLPKSGPSPFGSASPAGLAVLRVRLSKSGLSDSLEAFLRRMPGGAQLQAPVEALAPLMTGNVLIFVHRVEVAKGGLGTAEARARALKLAILVETTDGAAARASLDALLEKQQASPKPGPKLGVSGPLAYVYNDESALNAALAAVPSSVSKQTHALELVVDPALLARGLSQVSLLDAIQNPALAGLLAAGTELGPLLVASESLTGWADPTGSGAHRAQLTWSLKADRFP